MFKLGFHNILTGLEISANSICCAQIVREKGGWRLIGRKSVPLPEEVVRLSYQKGNILDGELFFEAIRDVLDIAKGKVTRVGLSIPNEVVKISIQTFDEMPATENETEKMIAWSVEKTLHFPGHLAAISYHSLDEDRQNGSKILVAMGMREVVGEYESKLRELKIEPRVIRPAGINQFNFYCPKLPDKGINAFLGLCENYFSYFVFEGRELTFFHGVKRGFSDLHFFQDVDMTMQHYLNANPEKEIERLFVGSQVAFHKELEEVFRNLSDMEITIIDESALIKSAADMNDPRERERLSSVVSAVGAAQSLVQ